MTGVLEVVMSELSHTEELRPLTLAEISAENDGDGGSLRVSDYDWYLIEWVTEALKRLELKKSKFLRVRQTKTLLVKKQFRDILVALFHQHINTINEIRAEEDLQPVELLSATGRPVSDEPRPHRKK